VSTGFQELRYSPKECPIVPEPADLSWLEADPPGDLRHFCSEATEILGKSGGACQDTAAWRALQKVAHDADCVLRIGMVRRGIVAAQVGKISGKPIRLGDHDFDTIVPVQPAAESFCAERQTEFKGHVEARQLVVTKFDARKIMDRAWTLSDQPNELVETDIAAVVFLQSTANPVSTSNDCKQECIEEVRIVVIERDVDKDVA
jgi:hypothetical protein